MPPKKNPDRTPSECPVCGADVPPRALACPACGADKRSGWNEENTRYDGLDLPDDSFDYDESLKEEGLKKQIKPRGVPVFWWVVGVGLTVLVIYRVVRGEF